MSLDLKALSKLITQQNLIVTPPLTEWMIKHGDDAFNEQVGDKIKELLTTKPRYRGKSFSSSSAGKCQRAQVYGYLDAPQDSPSQQLMNIYIDGKWRHLRWQAMLLAAGVLTEVEYPLPWPGMRSVGTMDGLGVVSDTHPVYTWRGKEFGWELKGVSTFMYGTLAKSGPLESHLNQVARYFLSSGLELFSIVYEDKTTQAIHEWVVEANTDDMKKRIARSRVELEELNQAIDNKVLPERLPECASLRGDTFKACNYGVDKQGVCALRNKWPKNDTFRKESDQ